MRLEKAVWHNMGPHSDWTLDLTALDPAQKLVALVGRNGRGKSFSLESAVAGACYRTMPTQGTVAARATAGDSWQESTIAYAGKRYRIRHSVNATGSKRTGETLVVDADTGRPAYEGGAGFKLFDAWAARHLPDPDVLFASIFASQQSEGFVKMTSGERIGIVLRVLGVARFERMATLARKNLDTATYEVDALTRRIADIRGGSRSIDACELELDGARKRVDAQQDGVDICKGALAAAQEAEQAAALAHERRSQQLNELARLQRELHELTTKREPVAVRVANNRAVLAEAEQIRAAAEKVSLLEEQIRRDEAAVLDHDTAARTVLAPWTGWRERHRDALARAQRAKARAQHAAAVKAATAQLPTLTHALRDAETRVQALTSQLDALQSLHVAGAAERIAALRQGYSEQRKLFEDKQGVLDAGELVAIGDRVVLSDDTAVANAEEVPTLIANAKAMRADWHDRMLTAQRQLSDAQRLADRAADVNGAGDEALAAEREAALLADGYLKAEAEAQQREGDARTLRDCIATNRATIAELKPLADKAGPLANAETRLLELEPQLAAFDAAIAKVEAEIAALPPLPEVPTASDVPRATAALRQAEASLQDAQRAVARAEQALESAKAIEARALELEQERAKHEAEVHYWARLALDFGRDGIQSAEVDSAGPELTELVNDLLHTCHGPRFTVSVETQRSSADGKKMVEECTIRVIDTVAGTDKEIREHSGGERVILGEAVSLALTMLACRRAGWERPTLIRDESAAALDPANARAWVAMMRRAVELTGADRLLFVSHSKEVIEMADAQIEVGAPSTEASAA